MRFFILSLLLLSTAACGKDTSTGHYNAVDEVLDHTNLDMEVAIGTPFLHSGNGRAITIQYGPLDKDVLGQNTSFDDYSCLITISDKLERKYIHNILRHEIGHCFGLDHSGDKTDVMYPEFMPLLQDNDISFARFIKNLNQARKNS